MRSIPEAKNCIRELIGSAPLSHDGKGIVAELGGIYQGVLAQVGSIEMVAGVGFEPTTFGL